MAGVGFVELQAKLKLRTISSNFNPSAEGSLGEGGESLKDGNKSKKGSTSV